MPDVASRSREDKISLAKRIIDIILINPDTMSGSEYLRQLCEYVDLDEHIVRSSIKRTVTKTPPQQSQVFFLPAEKRLLQILLEEKEIAEGLCAEARPEDFRGLRAEPALAHILECTRKGKRVLLPELSQAVGPDLSRLISELLQERAGPGSGAEARDCLQALRRTILEARLVAIQKEINRCDKSGEKETLAALLAEKQALTKKIMTM
jgi:hypothetical protein